MTISSKEGPIATGRLDEPDTHRSDAQRPAALPDPGRASMLGRAKRLAKDALAVPRVRRGYERAQRSVLNVFGSSRAAATAYSVPGLATFNREQYAVLAGRRRYYASLGNSERSTHVELRMAKTLGLQPYERVVCLVAVGYPRGDGLVASSQKKSLEVLRHFEPPLR